MDLYTRNAIETSKLTTKNYSTSFSIGVRLLGLEYRDAVYAIYGFVRFADEIVDTFHQHDKQKLLNDFKDQTFEAIENKISTNPILHAFQWVVNTYNVERHLIESFLESMEMDLYQQFYTEEDYKKYIYGSAEVVGLMCLQVFYSEERLTYEHLKPYARKLGEAFQKINFLRDIQSDLDERGRFYFPDLEVERFDNESKLLIEADIQYDFDEAFKGIKQLKPAARLGVYISYIYYLRLFRKIKNADAESVFRERYRVKNIVKVYLLMKGYVSNYWIARAS